MSDTGTVRWAWLRFMYIYTIVGAGGIGAAMLVFPDGMRSMFGWPVQDPVVLGITGSVYLAFALLSMLGLRSPLKFAPLLLLQLTYKLIWFAGLVLPLWLQGQFPTYGLVHAAIYASYIVGDLIALPFGYLFARQAAA